MKNIMVIIISCLVTSVFSQDKDITGTYYQSSGNPEGGSSFIILPNNNFVVTYFGGLRKGTWEEKSSGTYEFSYHSEPKFVLYGRKNPKHSDSLALHISVDRHRGMSVRLNGTENESFTPVFNEGANCFDYPYIYKQKENLKRIEAFELDFRRFREGRSGDLPQVYRFEIAGDFTEFILTGLSEEYSQSGSFTATYADSILTVDDGSSLKKSGTYEDLDAETLRFVKEHTETEIMPKVLEYGNEFFPHFESPTEDDLLPFTRIDFELVSSKSGTIAGKSLFIASCED